MNAELAEWISKEPEDAKVAVTHMDTVRAFLRTKLDLK